MKQQTPDELANEMYRRRNEWSRRIYNGNDCERNINDHAFISILVELIERDRKSR